MAYKRRLLRFSARWILFWWVRYAKSQSRTYLPPVGSFCRIPSYTHLAAGGFVLPDSKLYPPSPPVGSFCQIPSHIQLAVEGCRDPATQARPEYR